MQKEKINRKKLKAGVIVVLFLLSVTIISSASLIITDKEVKFIDDPLRTLRYNETNKELEIIENLTVFHLTINGNHVINGNTITNGDTSVCNASQICFEGNLTIGNETSYVHINETGILTLHGEARVEKEEKFDMRRVTRGTIQPDEETIQIGDPGSSIKVYVLSFDPKNTEECWFVWHTSFDLDPSEDIEFHMVWKPKDTWASGSYNWSLDYIIKHDDGANNTGATTSISEYVTPANADDFIETRFSTKITGATNDDMIFARFYLNEVGSTAIVDGHVIFVELKYYINKLGERGLT